MRRSRMLKAYCLLYRSESGHSTFVKRELEDRSHLLIDSPHSSGTFGSMGFSLDENFTQKWVFYLELQADLLITTVYLRFS